MSENHKHQGYYQSSRSTYRTPLTAEQYSALVVALEQLRGSERIDCTLAAMWYDKQCSDWCLVYLTQWFHIVGEDCTRVPYMVAELCWERQSASERCHVNCDPLAAGTFYPEYYISCAQ